jgi:dTDP-glucose pyrophosphorylase
MKALILAAGKGSRIRNYLKNTNKTLIKINGCYLLENSINYAINAGVSEIIIVVGHNSEEITKFFGSHFGQTAIQYVYQHQQLGVVHAIECAKAAINGEDFILMLGDEVLINSCDHKMVKEFNEDKKIFCICGFNLVEDIEAVKKTYSILCNDKMVISKLIEKPLSPYNNYQGTGHCVFDNSIYDFIDSTPINEIRNQKELPALIQNAINAGKDVRAFKICDQYFNINTINDLDMLKEWGVSRKS